MCLFADDGSDTGYVLNGVNTDTPGWTSRIVAPSTPRVDAAPQVTNVSLKGLRRNAPTLSLTVSATNGRLPPLAVRISTLTYSGSQPKPSPLSISASSSTKGVTVASNGRAIPFKTAGDADGQDLYIYLSAPTAPVTVTVAAPVLSFSGEVNHYSGTRKFPIVVQQYDEAGYLDEDISANLRVPFTFGTAPVCVVPHLVGLTLAGARRVLRHAHCQLGRVRELRRPQHHRVLRVRRQTAQPGTRQPAGYRVGVGIA
jgi:hypothetical protein